MQTTYRWMTEQDIPALGALTRRIWNAHYISIITQAQIDYMLEKFYAPDSLAGQLARGHRFLLLEKAQAILGFLSVSHASEASHPLLRGTHEGEENFFLHKFYIAQELQGKGIGKAMLAELLTRMPEIKRLRLQVARKNVNAWNFYLKQGFVIEREADFDIGDGYQMQDYVMEKQII